MTTDEKRLLAEAWQRCMNGTAKVIVRASKATLEDIAKRVGVQESTVWRWLEGQALARGSAGLRFAELLRELLPAALANIDQERLAAEDRVSQAEGYRRAVLDLMPLAERSADNEQAA